MRPWQATTVIAIFALVGAILLSIAGASTGPWSTPVTLGTCGAASTPKVVFPSEGPTNPTGTGAIVWLGPAVDCGASSPQATVDVAALDSSDEPGAAHALLVGHGANTPLVGPLYAQGTAKGEVLAVAGQSGTNELGSPEAVVADGRADGSYHQVAHSLLDLHGSDNLLATMDGFIGDADVATVAQAPGGGEEIILRAQRYHQWSLVKRRYLPLAPGAVTAIALGMDFRADRLVIWAQDGSVWAQYVDNAGYRKPIQRLGPSGYDPQISAVLSDDDRAFVIWTDEPPAGTSGVSTVLLAHSATGPRFDGTQTLASFTEPPDVRLTAGSVAAERLSNEGAVLLWPTMSAAGNYEVEAAGATEGGLLPTSVLFESGQDVRLGAVATGPEDEIVVVVEVAPRTASGFDQADQELLATRSGQVHGTPGVGFGTLDVLAPAGQNIDPAAAVDPSNDTAVVAWQTSSAAGVPEVDYSIGAGNP